MKLAPLKKERPFRTVWVVRSAGGYVGQRRFSYSKGSHHKEGVPFKHARIFTREQDTNGYVGTIIPITIEEPFPV